MANVIVNESALQNIANSIRLKTNTNNTFNIYEMTPAINNIPTTSSVEISDASYLFYSDTRISEINSILPMMTNLTNMSYIFGTCYNLTNVPNFETGMVTDMSYSFYFCNNLTAISNYNTSSVVNMRCMLHDCVKLVDIPMFDMSNVNDAYEMFRRCLNLSSNAYANIANMLPLAANLTNQSNLFDLGLSSSNFTIEQRAILNGKGYLDATVPYSNVYQITARGDFNS